MANAERSSAASVRGAAKKARRTVGPIAAVTIVIAALTGVDVVLARVEKAELRAEALQSNSRGRKLLAEGRAVEADDALRRAHSLDRRNAAYQLDLIEGLLMAGKTVEATPLMDNVLQREPNNGRANLIAARLAKKVRQENEAASYYHRAIYGQWAEAETSRKAEVRLELIDFLAAHGRKKELLAELLPLEDEARREPAIEARLAPLFLLAGSAERSAELYKALIRRDPAGADAYRGLGEAELARGRYPEAQQAFLSAFHRDSKEPGIRSRLQLSGAMTAMDPTLRRLTSKEKYRRSLTILELTRASLRECMEQNAQAAADENFRSISTRAESLVSENPTPPTNEIAEERLALAEDVWKARLQGCGESQSPKEEPLRLMMEKVLN